MNWSKMEGLMDGLESYGRFDGLESDEELDGWIGARWNV